MRYFNPKADIPQLLKEQPKWLCWQKGETDRRGKFPKYPVNPLNPFEKIAPENGSCSVPIGAGDPLEKPISLVSAYDLAIKNESSLKLFQSAALDSGNGSS